MTVRPSTDQVFETLRDRICLLVYAPGAVLREGKLAEEFGLSRTPIRSALQRLAHGGLVEPRDGVGTIVTAPKTDQIRDIYLMRMKIAELIGQMDPNPLTSALEAKVDSLRAETRDLTETFDINVYWRINHDLHLLIADVIGNSALRETCHHFYFQAARFWYQQARNKPGNVALALLAELDEVKRAVHAKDAVALGFVQRNSIAYGLAQLLS